MSNGPSDARREMESVGFHITGPPKSDRLLWKCRNGDTLGDLNDRKARAQVKLNEVRERHREALSAIQPIKKEEYGAWLEVQNISCRLNTWWNEYSEATRKA